MNSQQIETFLTIVETGSIVHASQSLFLSQPTVSYRLKSLESELGFDLFVRSKGLRNVELTVKGQAFVPIAEKYMSLWQEIMMLSATESQLPISISCPSSINRYLINPFSKYISEENRMFDISITRSDTDEVYKDIKDGKADIGFVFEKKTDSNIVVESIYSEKLVLIRICPDESEIRAAYHPAELNIEDEIFFNSGQSFIDWHKTWFEASSHPYVNIQNEKLLSDLFDDPRFWSVVPLSLARNLSKIPGMKIYELIYTPKPRKCYRITSNNLSEEKRRSVQVFNDCFRTYLHSNHTELYY